MADTKDMPRLRYLTNKVMSWVLSKMCGQEIPDTQCGFRLVHVDALRKLELVSDKYDIESEMLVEASERGLKVKSVPIRTIYGEETSEIKPIKDTIRFINLLFRFHLKYGTRRKKKTDGI